MLGTGSQDGLSSSRTKLCQRSSGGLDSARLEENIVLSRSRRQYVLGLSGLVATVLVTPAVASEIGQLVADQVSITSYQHILDDLLYTHDGNNRYAPDGPDHDPARANILVTFESFGLPVVEEGFEYSGSPGYNVIATQVGTLYPDSYFLIGAHYDSASTPGADDNGSGVAGVLEIARVLSAHPSEYTIKYVAFDAEERGLKGSTAYVNAHGADDILGMISLDMIAYDVGTYSAEIKGKAATTPIRNALLEAVLLYGGELTAETVIESYPGSNHGPFENANYQACELIEDDHGSNPCYHQACDSVDTPDYISYPFAADMARSVAGFLADHARIYHHPVDCSSGQGCALEPGADEDCNGNGVWDYCDIRCGTGQDRNLNGIPDDCEPIQTIYVDASNCPGPGTGSPEDPFCTIKTGIDAAPDGSAAIVDVVIADGLYTGSENKNLNFQGKAIKLRSASGNPAACIIDCQDSGRGFHFVGGETAATIVEGITVRSGFVASGSPGGAHGGGVYCASAAAPMLINCLISGNSASNGGGVYCASASTPMLINCLISGNSAINGGGVHCYYSRPVLSNCTLSGNAATSATYVATYGGGLSSISSRPTLIDCVISGNTATTSVSSGTARGGGIYCSSLGPRLINCSIAGNTASRSSTYSYAHGGGICCFGSSPELSACTISGNTAVTGGGGYCYSQSSPVLTGCSLYGNTASGDSGGGLYCDASNPVLSNSTIYRNTATNGSGGGVYCNASSPALINSTIFGNTASDGSGGGLYCNSSSPALINSTLIANAATGPARKAGGIYCTGSSNPTVINCTFTGNTAPSYGGVYCLSSSNPTLTNCVLWGDTLPEVYAYSSTPVVTYSDVQGGYAGEGNIDVDPGFALPDDTHLMPGSPCIDAGTNSPPGGLPAQDADGRPRPLDGNGDGQATADMGAYEFDPTVPMIAASPPLISLLAVAGAESEHPRILSIRNSGAGVLSWMLDSDAPWLITDTSQGDSTGEVDSVTLTADATLLSQGVYSARLVISGAPPAHGPRLVNVILNVGTTRNVPNPYPTIQAAIEAAGLADEVVVADGTYTGTGNKDLDFGGKTITVRSESGYPEMCIIDCQGAGRGFYFHSAETAESVVRGFTIRNGVAPGTGSYRGGGICCSGASPTVEKCTISGCTADNGGGVGNDGSASMTIRDCVIEGNTASTGGGVMVAPQTASDSFNVRLTNCLITGNTAANGGGLYYNGSPGPGITTLLLTNCIISNNVASSRGGGVYHVRAIMTVVNCTLRGNQAATYGGGLHCERSASDITVANSILWGDTPQEVYVASGALSVNHCDIQGGYAGTGNIDLDPGFAFGGDFHLTPVSPCIDAGTNTPGGGLPPQDADGNPRPLDGNGDGEAVADMGAYEFNPDAPAIALGPTQILFSVPEGQMAQQSQAISIWNVGAGTLQWQLSWDAQWLLADTVQGESTGEVDTVNLTADATALAHGTYSALATVTDPLASNSPRVIAVVLHVFKSLQVPSEYLTIQAAIDAATIPGDEVVVAAGSYTGTGNRDLDFRGKAVPVRSADGDPASCIIDCEGGGRGFYFHSGETAATIVQGLTIRNGSVISDSPGGPNGGGILCHSSPTLMNCLIIENASSGDGGGVYCSSSHPTLTNCTISGNTAVDGGGLRCSNASPVLTNCTIRENTARSSGGGVDCYYSSPTLSSCTIRRNCASVGGGMFCTGGTPTLINCTIAENRAFGWSSSLGGGLFCESSSLKLTNCTLSRNQAADGGGLYCRYSSSPKLTNSILWGNIPQEVSLFSSTGTPIVTYCDVQGGYAGIGNIDLDPGFAFDDDFHLTVGSPCIDAGTNTPSGGLPAEDADGSPRPLDGNDDGQAVADMGSHEFDPGTPAIALSPARIVFNISESGVGQEQQVLAVRNAGGLMLEWALDWEATWLQVEPVQGESAGEVDTVTLTVDAMAQGHGTYTTLVTVADPQASNGPRIVDVSLNVTRTLHVPSQYPTIQAALDAATTPGDQVVVADGTYTGSGNKNLDFHGRAITLRSASGNPAACIINCQNGGRGFYFHSGETAAAVVEGFTIRNGFASTGGPGGSCGGAVYCDNASPSLINCIFSGSLATEGGGLYCRKSTIQKLINCTISGNTAASGGGMFCYLSSGTKLTNCTVSGNSASANGSGVYVGSSTISIVGCTFSGNSAATNGGGLYCANSASLILANNILWSDTPQEIYRVSSEVNAAYCDIQGGYPGTGNIDTDPIFVDPDGPDNNPATWQDNDYRLSMGSPCIDAGKNSAVPADAADLDGDGDTTEPIPFDLDALPRFVDDPAAPDCPYVPDTCGTPPIVDMGAYEFQPPPPIPGDLNCDGLVDVNDIAPFALALVDPVAYQAAYPDCQPALADLNASGAADGQDIPVFVGLLLAP